VRFAHEKTTFKTDPSPLPKEENARILTFFSLGRRVEDEGKSYINSTTPLKYQSCYEECQVLEERLSGDSNLKFVLNSRNRFFFVSIVWMILLLTLGIFFRCIHLDHKTFWVDEVATAVRVAGYTKPEVIESVTYQQHLTVADLQRYQQLTTDRSWNDTLRALTQSPEHTPLYFVLARLWQQCWGSSISSLRSLSVLFSILSLPCFYWLGLELFQSSLVGAIALSFLSVSPFYVAYAQEARPYSLWTLTILLSCITLLRAVRSPHWNTWGWYAIALTTSLYTSLLSLPIALAHGLYVLFGVRQPRKALSHYAVALGIALLSFTPWILVLLHNWGKLQDNTTWARASLGALPKLAIWIYSIIIVFVDFPVYIAFDPVIVAAVVTDLGLLALIGFAFYLLCQQTPKPVWLFGLTLTAIPFISLVLIDWITQGQASATSRYLIPTQLGILLAIAYLFAKKLSIRLWSLILAIILSFGIASCVTQLDQAPLFQKSRNSHNRAIATLINADPSPYVLTESSQIMDLLSLSHQLKSNTQFEIASNLEDNFPLLKEGKGRSQSLLQLIASPLFLFNPSDVWLNRLQHDPRLKVQQIYQPNRLMPGEIALSLWQITIQR
jgi:uncharacterized membrane protein